MTPNRRRRLTAAASLLAVVLVGAAACASHPATRSAAGQAAPLAQPTVSLSSDNPVAPPTTPPSTTNSEPSGSTSTSAPSSTAPTAEKPSAPVKPTAPRPNDTASSPGTTHNAPPPPAPLKAVDLPNAAAVDWQPTGGLVAMTLPAVGGIDLSECATVSGAAAWHEQGYASAQNTPAQEDIFGFTDTATATRAFQAIADGLNGCQQTSRDLQHSGGVTTDATVTTTATTAQGLAWARTWTAVPGASAAGPQTNHYYLVQHGATVIVAAFTEFGANPPHRYDTTGDPAVITMLAAHAVS
ncbi:hypothetical protein ABH935_007131 [Catenulispora sp. GAS73]|uniref:hypothetical protein n=1 Tax=Catenulispora sp. GAS73 TaxID=3156269 RepID=UPI0035129313